MPLRPNANAPQFEALLLRACMLQRDLTSKVPISHMCYTCHKCLDSALPHSVAPFAAAGNPIIVLSRNANFDFVFSLFLFSGEASSLSFCRLIAAADPLSPSLANMRRSSTRKSGPANPTVNSSAVDLFRSASSKASAKELERIDHLFYSYADKSSDMIEPEGIESLCADLVVDHTDVRILMLAWKMKADKQGYFTLEEWRRGLKALRADNISKMKKALPELEKEVRRPQNFTDFYSYAFRYCLTEDKQKSIDIESICVLLDLVLGSEHRPQVDSLTEYLKNQHDYKVINMDQWMSFLRFCNEIYFPGLDNYDSALAWPLILDNFVEWMKEKQKS